jgi:hypothetical protein
LLAPLNNSAQSRSLSLGNNRVCCPPQIGVIPSRLAFNFVVRWHSAG